MLQLKANKFELHLLTYLILFSGQPYLLEMLYLPVEGTEFEGQYMKVKISWWLLVRHEWMRKIRLLKSFMCILTHFLDILEIFSLDIAKLAQIYSKRHLQHENMLFFPLAAFFSTFLLGHVQKSKLRDSFWMRKWTTPLGFSIFLYFFVLLYFCTFL